MSGMRLRLLAGLAVAAVAAAALVALPGAAADAATFPVAPATELIRDDFSVDEAAPAFGFDRDGVVAGGALQLNNTLASEATAVKRFPAEVAGQSVIDVSFDWTFQGTRNAKGGLEFRDAYGRLVFALQGAVRSTGAHELRHSTVGVDTDSSSAKFAVEPTWSSVALVPGREYGIRFQADFASQTVSYRVADGAAVLVERIAVPIRASGLDRMVAMSSYREASNAQTVDDLVVLGSGDAPEALLAGSSMYAFGDSIVAGHMYPKGSFPDFVARREGMTVIKRAVNGATIMPTSNSISSQIAGAPAAGPDYVLFDGGTNDAYPPVLDRVGAVSGSFTGPFDTATFAGALEDTVFLLSSKYPDADLVFVAVHKLGARDYLVQEELREIELAVADKWGVAVADVWDSALDTRSDEQRVEYSFDSLQASGLPGTAGTTGAWTDAGGQLRPSGTHPNLPAIEEFFAPIVSDVLRGVAELRPGREDLAARAASISGAHAEHDYTAESWAKLSAALEDARAVAGASNATAGDIDAARVGIDAAVAGLVPASGLALRVDATGRCVADRIVVVVSLANDESAPVEIGIATPYGRRLATVPAGNRGSYVFDTRASRVDSAIGRIAASGSREGSPVAVDLAVELPGGTC